MIRIITDSTCEAPPEVLAHPRVTVLPLLVVFGQQTLRDGIDITREEFWARLPKSNPLPTTSQVAPADFITLFQRFTEAGDEVVALTISAKLSGTYSSAAVGRDSQPNWPVDVVDSRSTSVGLGLLVEEALRLADQGADRDEIVARLIEMCERVHVIFAVETLEYLQRGGRIGKAQAFVGTLLKFKPLLGIQEGEVVPVARVRSRAKALESLQDALLQQVPGRGPQVRLGVTHAQVPEEAAVVARSLAERFETPNVFICDLGPVLGTHVGPGTIGAAVYAPK
jgi:DegV family protein with EDD domain